MEKQDLVLASRQAQSDCPNRNVPLENFKGTLIFLPWFFHLRNIPNLLIPNIKTVEYGFAFDEIFEF
jgi:hypothetical protein